MRAPTPRNEGERLQALQAYEILDTDREQEFDDLVDVAAHVSGCPIAMVSLVDAERQWFKACVGIGERETSREISFCAHAILTPEQPLIVPNALLDERFAENANVLGEPGIRFYAGIPLVNPAGLALGSLCVIDRVPRTLTDTQLELLKALGRQVTRVLELRRVSKQLAGALAQVKTLEGLLPICCECKAIKNDAGDWTTVEGYMMERTSAKFTHGYCPDCAEKFYADMDVALPDPNSTKR